MSKNKSHEPRVPLPPKIPEDLKELERAIMLLGSLRKVGLGQAAQDDLARLLGVCPSSGQASAWKTALAKIRRERVAPLKPPTPGEEAGALPGEGDRHDTGEP